MNRRQALWQGLVTGGIVTGSAWAQDPAAPQDDQIQRAQAQFRRAGSGATAPAGDEMLLDRDRGPSELSDAMPPGLPTEAGQLYKSYDISRYTSLPHNDSEPQNALVEWIFRRTGSSTWHGDSISVLSASRAQLRVYHDPKVVDQVAEVVERFVDAQPSDYLKIRVRAVSASDTRWRYAVATRLNPVATGEQGQQVWTLNMEDAAMVRTQMQIYQGFKLLMDQDITLINGQTLTIIKEMEVEYVSGPQKDSAVGQGYQPTVGKLKEGASLRASPLLTYEGDAVDVALDLKINTIRKLIPTKILTRRETGPTDMTIDVPEMSETRLNQTISGWKIGQTLVIAAGIHPGILQSKAGFMNLRIPGTTPTRTELLIFLDIEPVGTPSLRDGVASDGVDEDLERDAEAEREAQLGRSRRSR